MRRLGRKTRFACTVLAFLLISVFITVSAPNSPSHGVVLSVAAQNEAASDKTVRNNVSVLTDSISLGGSLNVEGTVYSSSGPWNFTTVALHVDDKTVARTLTNESGAYVFSVPVGLNYVPIVFSGGASIYTVAESDNPALPVPSAVVRLAVNAIPAYGIVAGIAGIAGITILGLYGYTRGGAKGHLFIGSRLAAARQRFPSFTRAASRRQEGAETSPNPAPVAELGIGSNADEPTKALPLQAPGDAQLSLDDPMVAATERAEAPLQPAPVSETKLALETARDLFDQGKNQPAAGVLYEATVTCLAKVHGVTLAPSMTHREKYAALQRAAPDIRKPLLTLTVAYERTTYAGEALTKEQQNTAIEACKLVCKRVGSADRE